MIDFLIGAIAVATFFLLFEYFRKCGVRVAWWGWLLTVMGILYAVFTLEVIIGFLSEGAGKAALVMGLILTIIAVIWAVLMQRFVYKKTV